MTPLLDVRGLRGGYGRVEVLRGVDLCVNRGEIVALLGSNGAGKSTLNNAVCGINPAWGGTVQFNGVDLTRAHYRVIVKAGLIQVPEGRKVFPNLTVRENLELGSFTRARERRAQNVERVFVIFPRLRERVAQRAGLMSGGEQQMLAIGRALMAKPKILLLDEPLLGLSPAYQKMVMDSVREIQAAKGITIIIAEQFARPVIPVINRGYVIENGSAIMEGTKEELMDNPDVKSAYFGV
jgi:branched-chain amino acid transport system ATP-binding protein